MHLHHLSHLHTGPGPPHSSANISSLRVTTQHPEVLIPHRRGIPEGDRHLLGPDLHGHIQDQWREKEGERAFVSEGNLFQVEGCPYALSREQADRVRADESEIGNTITLSAPLIGRTGNHFLLLSAYFAMGYCCRSRLLSLPTEDEGMLPDEDKNFTSEHSWFDFSDVTLPWPEFQGMGDDPEICPPQKEDSGKTAFGFNDVHPMLMQCMNRVYLRGCEKVHLGNLVDTDAFCPEPKTSDRRGSGSLVIHIRSGDIFKPNNGYHLFGQPPLEYFLRVLHAREWDSVTILTWAEKETFLNPIYNILKMMADAGTLGKNVRLFKDRSLVVDIREMLCADALAVTRSSLSMLTVAHSRASVFFLPSKCGNGLYRRMQNPPVKAAFDNTTLLLLERPQAEVFGTDWPSNGTDYSVYDEWQTDDRQLLEMIAYNGIKGLRKCDVYK